MPRSFPDTSRTPGVPIAVTMGEPAGIGAEIALRAWQFLRQGPAFFMIHDPAWVAEVGRLGRIETGVVAIAEPGEAIDAFREGLPVLPIGLPAPIALGEPDARNAHAVIEAIRQGVELARSGKAYAVVTNPIQKSTLYQAGFSFPGHTEYLEHLAGAPFRSTMMLASEGLRVVPVTIHQSLRSALDDLSTQRIVDTARRTVEALRRDFAIDSPRLAIAGLNPHAGESGAMGREEIDLISPAVLVLRAEGIEALGPLSPDTMFTPRSRARYDAAICMYHDQALIPLKTLDVDGGVNITLGLPFVRTSPDHGTALDLAGKGIADPGSLVAAIRMADRIAFNRMNVRSAA